MDSEGAIRWAKAFLEERGCLLQSEFVPVTIAPWSCVYRIDTSVGAIYLKQMPPVFSIEARLLLHLGVLFPNKVPEIVGHNDSLYCFLMFDAGISLRSSLKKEYVPSLAIKALTIYASIQQGSITDMDSLLALGVSDWRLATLPFLYQELLGERNVLLEDGLTELQLKKLKKSHTRFAALCKQLQNYDIPETIEHGDFQDNNCLIYGKDELMINDWGETVISHPFFSLVSFLTSAVRQGHIREQSMLYFELRDAYLINWQSFESKSWLLEAFELVRKLSPIKFALSFYRVAQCPGIKESGNYTGAIAKALNRFLEDECSM